jgi:hypothetical protein
MKSPGVEGRFTSEWSSSDSGIWPDVRFTTSNGNDLVTIGPSGKETISDADRQRFANLYDDLLGRMSQVTQTFYSDRNGRSGSYRRPQTAVFLGCSRFGLGWWVLAQPGIDLRGIGVHGASLCLGQPIDRQFADLRWFWA